MCDKGGDYSDLELSASDWYYAETELMAPRTREKIKDTVSDTETDTEMNPKMSRWASPLVRSESYSREIKRVCFEREQFRRDPYDNKMYTKNEFREYYGTDEMWEECHPKGEYRRYLIWECIERGKELNLSDELIKHVIHLHTIKI
jgi:hypothetical protein